MNRVLVLGLCIFVFVSFNIGLQLNVKNPKAEMDEECHIPQAFLYCDGVYDQWDPKLTTLPGLYIFSVGAMKLLQRVIDIPCSVFTLRMFNLAVNSLSFILLHFIVLYYHSFVSKWQRLVITMTLAIFPLNYFYTFMYYTEPLAEMFILAMHLMWIRKCYNLSALAGFLAVLTRQTSIVWVAFHGVLTINEIHRSAAVNNSISNKVESISKYRNSQKDLQCRECNNNVDPLQLMTKSITFLEFYLKLRPQLLAKTGAYLLVGVIFVVFVYINNGIVVGDREHHTVSMNFPQIFYFALFTGILTLPHLISQSKQISKFACSNKFMVIFILLINIVIVHFNTVAHYYNLTDNHHYTHHFLIFIYYNSIYALSLVPLYTICSLYVIENSIRTLGKFMCAVFLFTLALNLIPHLLLEFRYFVPGFLFFRMRLISRQWKVLLSEFAIYFTINVVTLWLYIVRPTLFPDDESQIIMW